MKSEQGLSFLSAEEMAEADKIAIEDFGIDVLSLMENAGIATAKAAWVMLGGVSSKKVRCLVGKGNNGGDGLVAARHLRDWGADVTVLLGSERGELKDIPSRQLGVIEKMGFQVDGPEGSFDGAELIVDALLGYNSRGDPREPVGGLIRRANGSRVPILAVDLPSGLDASTGRLGTPCIQASATVTFAFPKLGFLTDDGRRVVGELFLADISFPGQIYKRFGMAGPPFGADTFVKVW